MNASLLDSFITEKMTSTRLPGLSIALVRGDDVVYAKGFGVADIEQNKPATPDTVYGAASITKSFVAIAILQLAERGLIRLQDSVAEHLNWPLTNPHGVVRIEHLLAHTSGWAATAYIEAILRHAHQIGGIELPIRRPADVIAFLRGADDWVECPPGERWHYFNEGYVALGEIIARLTGQPYEQYIRRHILQPLGMVRSFFDEADIMADGGLASCYVLPNNGQPPRRGRYLFGQLGGDSGLFTNVLDLAKYASMLLAGGRGVMSGASFSELTQPRIALPTQPVPDLFGGAPGHYCLGLSKTDFLGQSLFAHSGSLIVSTGYLGFLPRQNVGVAVLSNGNGYGLGTLGKVALAILLGHAPSDVLPVKLAEQLDRLTGTYETYRDTFHAEVRRKGDFLELSHPGGDQPPAGAILVPERFRPNEADFFTYTDGSKLPAVFRIRDGQIELVLERYKYRRTGDLPR